MGGGEKFLLLRQPDQNVFMIVVSLVILSLPCKIARISSLPIYFIFAVVFLYKIFFTNVATLICNQCGTSKACFGSSALFINELCLKVVYGRLIHFSINNLSKITPIYPSLTQIIKQGGKQTKGKQISARNKN